MSIFTKKNVLIFLGGAVCSVICKQIGKSKCARKAAVDIVAKGIKIKDDVTHTVVSIKEEAEDIYEEAKDENSCDCGCSCTSTTEA